jgi:hypothetical protein
MALLVFAFLTWLRRLGFFVTWRAAPLEMGIVILSLRIRPAVRCASRRLVLFGRHLKARVRFEGGGGVRVQLDRSLRTRPLTHHGDGAVCRVRVSSQLMGG